MAGAGAVLLVACGLDTRHQLGFWRDNITLFKHAVEVTPENNFVGYCILGNSYADLGNLEAAASNYVSALAICPSLKEARGGLGNVLLLQKKYAEAEAQFRELLREQPDEFNAHTDLGKALAAQDRIPEARLEYEQVLAKHPDDEAALDALAAVTPKTDLNETLSRLFAALKIRSSPGIHARIAAIQSSQGQFPEAVAHYQAALETKPASPEIENNLAWLLATCPDARVRDGRRAVQIAEHACQATQSKITIYLGSLAAAYAEAGRFDDAIATAQKACALASAHAESDLLKRNQELLAAYQKHQAWHEPGE
jgi:tetratricopeptide (TPR) repeat protein